MKDFDIEKLERENIYTAPEDFFAAMQANVLREIAPRKKAKSISLNWAYAAAAAVTLLFGLTFFVNQDHAPIETVAQSTEAEIADVPQAEPAGQPSEATVAYKTLTEDLTSVSNDYQKANSAPPAIAERAEVRKTEKPRTAQPNPEVQVDQILANITSAELADLGKNAEQDVYLDLYY